MFSLDYWAIKEVHEKTHIIKKYIFRIYCKIKNTYYLLTEK